MPKSTIHIVHPRASQINGCSVCVDMHARDMKKAGEADERIFGVAAWRENPRFTEEERAALELTEALTRISDRPDAGVTGFAMSERKSEIVVTGFGARC